MSTHEFLFRLLTLYLFPQLLIPWLSLVSRFPLLSGRKALNDHCVLQGWFSVRREARLSILGFLVLNLFFIGLWAAMFDS